jgi:hypothetical protein
MKNSMLVVVLMALSTFAGAQRCDSVSMALTGDWKPGASAPRDGRIIEIMETYGIAPWYARVKWLKKGQTYKTIITIDDGKGHQTTQPYTATESTGRWMEVDDPAGGPSDDECLFWRPTKQTGKSYDDPTHGAQKSVAYWCSAMHRPYDSKTDSCK